MRAALLTAISRTLKQQKQRVGGQIRPVILLQQQGSSSPLPHLQWQQQQQLSNTMATVAAAEPATKKAKATYEHTREVRLHSGTPEGFAPSLRWLRA